MLVRACKSPGVVGLVVIFVGLCVLARLTAADPSPKDLRAKADADFKAGNYRDAWEIDRKLALDPKDDPKLVGHDLHQGLKSLAELNREDEIDAFRDAVVAAHGKNWRLLQAAANSFFGIDHAGYLIGGEFHRGFERGGGESVGCRARDRVRTLQLLRGAIDLLGSEPDRDAAGALYFDFAVYLEATDAWRLQLLTDLSKLPDYEPEDGSGDGSTHGAPVDADGNPVFHHLPKTYETAKSDGERWRWALSQTATFSPKWKNRAALRLADFCRGQFSVQTLVGPFREASLTDELGAQLSVRTLSVDETIAQLANGIKRFKLPEEFNYLRIYRQVAQQEARPEATRALETLAQCYESRRQFPKAADVWRELIRRFGPGPQGEWQKRLDQIVGNWGSFEPTPTQPAVAGRTIRFRFRNGKRLHLEAAPINVEKLVGDLKEYLKSNPQRLEHSKIDLEQIGFRLVQENQTQYLGPPAANWDVELQPRPDHLDRQIEVPLPLQKGGAYLITAKLDGGNTSRIVLWLADMALVLKPMQTGRLYLLADAVTGKPIVGANIEFFGFQVKQVARRSQTVRIANFAEQTDAGGQAIVDKRQLDAEYQWVAIARSGGRLAFLGFEGVWYGGADESPFDRKTVYGITDRPVYRPGQTLHWKFWIAEARYDAPENSKFAGQTYKVRLTGQQGETLVEKEYIADQFGGLDGEFRLPDDVHLGWHSLALFEGKYERGSARFQVEEYKKPEFEVTVTAPTEPTALGDKFTATIKATYYFGGPVTQANVHYTIKRTAPTTHWFPIGLWDWCFGSGYWWFWPDSSWYPGWREWGTARPSGWGINRGFAGPEVVADATVPIGPDGTVKVTTDTALAKTLHGDSDHRYEITANVTDQSRRTIDGTGEVLVARKPFDVVAWTDQGHYRVGDAIRADFSARTLDGKPVKGKGTATLYRVTFGADAKPIESAVQTWDVDTDEQGQSHLQAKASQAGQYRLSYKVTDAKQQTIEGAVFLTILGEGVDSAQFRFNDLELIPDRREYKPGDKVRLLINTNRADSTVVLFVRPAQYLYPKPQIVHVTGKSLVHEIPIEVGDMPNFFVEALTISNGRLYTESREIIVPPEKRIVNVAVEPAAHEYKPGAKSETRLKLTDLAGKPVRGSIVVSVYDKSVEYISNGSNLPEIRQTFWGWRRFHYTYGSSSLDRTSVDLLKQNETPMTDLSVVWFGGTRGMGGHGMGGGMGGNKDWEDTDERRPNRLNEGFVRLKSRALPVGQPGPVAFSAAPNYAADATVSGEKQSKSDAPPVVQPTVRSQFADTAYWNARIESDPDGFASVAFPMPENLTTWKIRAWTLAPGTRVGEGAAEVITTKNLLVRMEAPRFFVETDEVVLSAIVHNRLKTSKNVRALIEFDGKSLSPLEPTEKTIEVPAGGEVRVDWRVKAAAEGEAVVRMKALTDEESDAVEQRFPVRVHGMLKTEAWSGSIRPDKDSATFQIAVPERRRVKDTLLEIRYSPSLAAALVDALPYLVRYPHDTTDCTLNRFLPTVIVQDILKRMNVDLAQVKQKRADLNAQELGDPALRAARWKRFEQNPVFDNAEVTRMVKGGVQTLTEMQLTDGGWGWFSGWGEHSDPHTTALIVHGLQIAQQNGAALVPETLEKGVAWLKAYQADQLARLKRYDKSKLSLERTKAHADNLDALVYMTLVDADVNSGEMQDFLYRDRTKLSVYANGILGLALAKVKANERLAIIVQNIDQFLVQDNENQTAYLKLPEGSRWWIWFDSDTEANAYYLKLLARTDPKGEKAARLAKYLLNNRKHATYWNSTRDTAICIEALADFWKASGEDRPEMTVEVSVDGHKVKEVSITPADLFTYDDRVAVAGDALGTGPHKIELHKRGKGSLYFNAYLTTFTLEDFITRAGLEIKVDRAYYKLTRADEAESAAGSRGQVVSERREKYRRELLPSGSQVKSGDLLEIELILDSKNDYEQIVLEDPKAAGVEPFDVQSGYNAQGLGAYVELRDEKVNLFLRELPRGRHSLRYRMRAEIPGTFSALPAIGSGMYAPELKANSDELKLRIGEVKSEARMTKE
jgi:alpha-2-macroglobulin